MATQIGEKYQPESYQLHKSEIIVCKDICNYILSVAYKQLFNIYKSAFLIQHKNEKMETQHDPCII